MAIADIKGKIILRGVPYPYQAMLAICSDLDETPSKDIYLEILKYLNTTKQTLMGAGVGLEVGNTIYFDMPGNQFSYWNTDDHGRIMIQNLIGSGHIDCLHSYGDLALSRDHAGRALDELSKRDCRLEVWVDHGTAPSNLGADIMHGKGDIRGSEVYHADLTYEYGIRYVWRGRVTSVTAQDAHRKVGGIWSGKNPYASAKTMVKEAVKGILGRRKNSQYSMHVSNAVIREAELRSGHPVYEFIRSNPYWGGVGRAATADGLASVMTGNMLDRLVELGGKSVLYTHLGKIKSLAEPFTTATRNAFNLLSKYYTEGKILVTTTRRLLGYCRAMREVKLSINSSGGLIDLETKPGMENDDLAGLTVYTDNPEMARVTINGRDVGRLRRNGADHTGRPSVSLPWDRLEYPIT